MIVERSYCAASFGSASGAAGQRNVSVYSPKTTYTAVISGSDITIARRDKLIARGAWEVDHVRLRDVAGGADGRIARRFADELKVFFTSV